MGTNYLGVSSLSLCNDYNRVVVAGRSLLKIFSFNEKNKTFVEQLNLQGGRRDVSLNFYFIAVAFVFVFASTFFIFYNKLYKKL